MSQYFILFYHSVISCGPHSGDVTFQIRRLHALIAAGRMGDQLNKENLNMTSHLLWSTPCATEIYLLLILSSLYLDTASLAQFLGKFKEN